MNEENLFLVQYGTKSSPLKLGLQRGNGAINPLRFNESAHTLPSLLDTLLAGLPTGAAGLLDMLQKAAEPAESEKIDLIHAPVNGQEIWAAGVTYKRSEEARELESNNSNMYTRVYHAVRPELFMKAMGYDAVGSGQQVGIRYDAIWSVPEPELVVVLNARMEVIGFTIGNDMSSRDIEGENPLYLPQAKVYEAACAVGPRIWLQPGATEFPDLKIEVVIERGGRTMFSGETRTTELHRSLSDLVDYLGRCKRFPMGALLFTGTGVVPPDDFTLLAGDTVRVRIDPIGELVNTVKVVGESQKFKG